MFESIVAHGTPGQPPAGTSAVSMLSTLSPLSTVDLEALVNCLAHLEVDVDDAQRITQLGLLERLKGAAAAAQARVSVDFEASQRREQAAAGPRTVGQGVRGHVVGLGLLRGKRGHATNRGLPKILRRQRAKLGQAGRDRPDTGHPCSDLGSRPELEQGHADEKLAADSQVGGVENLVAVDERPVARVEVLDACAVVDRGDARVSARHELVLGQRSRATRIPAELDGAAQLYPTPCLRAFHDLENVIRHRSALLGLVHPVARVSIGQEVETAKPSCCG